MRSRPTPSPSIIWILLVAVGIVALCLLAYGIKSWNWDKFWFGEFGTTVLTTYLSAAVIGLLYECLVRKTYLKEAMDLAHVGESIADAGIVRYGTSFNQIAFSELICETSIFEAYFCYAGNWVEGNRRAIREALRSGTRAVFFLSNPQNDALLKSLASKWQEAESEKYSPEDIKRRINESTDVLKELYLRAKEAGKEKTGSLTIYYSNSDAPYSYYRNEKRILFVPNKICRDKSHPVHFIEARKLQQDAGLYAWVLKDVEELKRSPGVVLAWESNRDGAVTESAAGS